MNINQMFLSATALLAAPVFGQTNTFPSSGSVGIGTTSPQNQFHLSAGEPRIQLTPTSFGTGYSNGSWIGMDTTGLYFIQRENASTRFLNDGTEIMRLTNGNVGIGTANPTLGKLEVVEASTYSTEGTAGIDINTGVNGHPELEMGVDDASMVGYIQSFSKGTSYAGVPLSLQPNGGNVGIGKTTPQARLSLVNASGVTLQLDKPTGASIQFSRNGTNGYQIDDSSGAMRWLSAAATEQMRLDASGNLGIGTPNPTQKLSVNGSIRAKEVIVDTGWSDFVFDPGYKLKALSDTEEYIQSEHRLPDMPSAKEIAEHGVTLGEMQSKLLAKIEELTLHVIAQEKRSVAQQSEIAALRTQLGQISPK